MWTNKTKLWRFTLCILFTVGALAVTVKGDEEVPSESQCRPFVEKALKELGTGDAHSGSSEDGGSHEISVDDSTKDALSIEDNDNSAEDGASIEVTDEPYVGGETAESLETEGGSGENSIEDEQNSQENESNEKKDGDDSKEDTADEGDSKEEADGDSKEDASAEDITAEQVSAEDDGDDNNDYVEDARAEEDDSPVDKESLEVKADDDDSKEADNTQEDDTDDSNNTDDSKEDHQSDEVEEAKEVDRGEDDDKEGDDSIDSEDSKEFDKESKEVVADSKEDDSATQKSKEDVETEEVTDNDKKEDDTDENEDSEGKSEVQAGSEGDDSDGVPEEELMMDTEVPENLRSREHITQILRLDAESSESEILIERSADIILRDLKRIYENSIKPLETLYKYRDLSNRHFGDPEIFSKPLVLFMGPWSGGKSSILNYLTGLEFTEWSLRSGAEPSPAYFNILMHGAQPEVLDGTQLAADWTFSGLQKFGQGLEERLRGLKYPSKLLEKVNIVEIPGILEVRKQVSRVFPFNDACQWFIDRADIIFLVYDPAKLDVGPETEAILDQLKGRESQTRIVLNKADRVKPEELMRVQSALIWNISPLMSSAQPPAMYTVSLWSLPWEEGAPARLLRAQENELLRDLRTAIDRRIENKISSARRFAVRVRNHAKMVDCYLTTYYNHKTIFGNKKLIADAIIESPQNYHIYEGLSTLTNISRYDLPDPETYRDFFRLNPLYEFQQLSATCTYFRGCPINKLDIAIAYDLPELVGKYKKMVETATPQGMPKS